MDHNIIGRQIMLLRKRFGLTQEDLALKLGYSKQTISNWETGLKIPRMGAIQKISDLFNVSKSFIIDGDFSSTTLTLVSETTAKLEEPRQKIVLSTAEKQLEEQENDNVVQFPKQIVTGRSTAAGAPIDGDNEDSNASTMIVDKVEIPKSADEIVTIAGNSMEPTYPQGSQVFVHWQPEVEQGEVAVVAIKDEGVTCKKVFYDWEEEEIILRSINEEYPDRIFPMDYIRIIGKVVV